MQQQLTLIIELDVTEEHLSFQMRLAEAEQQARAHVLLQGRPLQRLQQRQRGRQDAGVGDCRRLLRAPAVAGAVKGNEAWIDDIMEISK